jgi:ABC-type Fe3+ transport system substrate-binding protein
MPLFFAHRLKDPRQFEIVFPEEGAIISPVFLLVKKERKAEAAVLSDFVLGREMGQFCADAGFPSVRGDVSNRLPAGCRLSWMGWDFLAREDPLEMKRTIASVFAEQFGTGGRTS